MPTDVPPPHGPRGGRFVRAATDRLRGGHGRSTATLDRTDAPIFAEDEPRFARDPVAPDDGRNGPLDGRRTAAVAPVAAAATRGRRYRRGGFLGARSALGATGGRRRAGWLLPLLGLLILGALVIGALSLLGGDSDKQPNRERQPAPQQQNNPSPAPAPSGGAAARPGQLAVAGQSVATGASLQPFIGQNVDAKGLEVVQVDGEAGFFVGGGKGERTFVEYGPGAGGNEATAMPKVGDRVDLTGPVAQPPKQPGRTFGVPVASERVILKQGGYINADTVTAAS